MIKQSRGIKYKKGLHNLIYRLDSTGEWVVSTMTIAEFQRMDKEDKCELDKIRDAMKRKKLTFAELGNRLKMNGHYLNAIVAGSEVLSPRVFNKVREELGF